MTLGQASRRTRQSNCTQTFSHLQRGTHVAHANVPAVPDTTLQMILIASPSKPPLLTEKGTIKRAATLAQYDADVNELYSNLDATALADVAAPVSWTAENSAVFVRAVVQHVVPAVTSDTQDLFDRGCTRFVIAIIPFAELM